jgi:hypothetical protein
MDFIEKLFGISPDNGSGVFEIGLLFLVSATISALAMRRKNKASRRI